MSLLLSLTTEARHDITVLTVEGLERFGEHVADSYVDEMFTLFDRLAAFPDIGTVRRLDPEVRIVPYRSHVVLYERRRGEVLILRVRHGREDWLRELQED